jgi:tetratricopeptide (TPR) repeat protein
MNEDKDDRKVAEPSPTLNTSSFLEKGNDAYDKGDYHDAIKEYEKVLNDPNYKSALMNKGGALYLLGKQKEALEYFDKALEIDPNYVWALNNKGTLLRDLGKQKVLR